MNSQLSNSEQDAREWYEKVIYSCNYHEADMAAFALGKWDEMVGLLPGQQKDEVTRLQEKLLFTAFPSIPISQAVEAIEKKLLDILASEVDIDEILKKRFLYAGYGNENEERKMLREAVLRNQQPIGGKKVFEWLRAFDKAFPPEGEDEAAAGKFFTQNPDITALSKTEQALLRRLLQVYDEWLRAPLMSIFDATAVYKKLMELEQAGVKEINVNTFEKDYFPSSSAPRTSGRAGTIPTTAGRSQASSQNTVSLPLLQALSKYERLGEQLITRGRIKVGAQTEPVRPSLLYWLKYYRDELGIGQHSSVERGNFLFRSENGKNLSSEERERINIILKSVEENFPLTIDPKNQEIIFPASNAFSITSASTPASNSSHTSGKSSDGRGGAVRNFPPVHSSYANSVAGVPAFVSAPVFKSAQTRVSQPLPKVATIGTPAFFVPRPEESEVSEKKSPTVSPISFFNSHEGDGRAKETVIPPVQAKSVSFSTSHIFPAEKEAAEMRVSLNEAAKGQVVVPEKEIPSLSQSVSPMPHQDEAVAPASQPASTTHRGESVPNFSQSSSAPKKLNSFRIRPVSLGGRD